MTVETIILAAIGVGASLYLIRYFRRNFAAFRKATGADGGCKKSCGCGK